MEQNHVAIAGIGCGCLAVFVGLAFLVALFLAPLFAALALVQVISPGEPPEMPVPPQLRAFYGQVADGYNVFWQHLAAWDGAVYRFRLPMPTEQQIYAGFYSAAREQRRKECERMPPEEREKDPLCNPPHLSPEEIEQLRRAAHRHWVRLLLDHIEGHARQLQAEDSTRDDQHGDRPGVDWAALVGNELEERAATLALGYTTAEALEDEPDLLFPGNPADADFIPEGTFLWPVQGEVRTHFGYRYLGSPPRWRLHPGMDIRVTARTPVRAARAGRVVRAGPDAQYGNLVVIDHGGYTTWYGLNGTLHVAAGDQVAQGQAFAVFGDAPTSALHFEVRFQDEPHNPLLFLP